MNEIQELKDRRDQLLNEANQLHTQLFAPRSRAGE